MNTTLSFVIVEYHSIDEVNSCVDSIIRCVHTDLEIIVSSNSCYTKEEQARLTQGKENVRWVFNKKNGGFAYAMNQGLKESKGDYLIIMNSDCIINYGIEQLADFLNQHAEVGVVAPQIYDKEGNIQDTAREYVSLPHFVYRQIKRILRHKVSILDNKVDYSSTQTVDWVIGAFMMVSREAYRRTGGLDESFFMYAEDLDWCTRVRQCNLEVVYCPFARVSYKGTRRARSNRKYAKIFIRSHILYWKKFGFFWGYPKRKPIKYGSCR